MANFPKGAGFGRREVFGLAAMAGLATWIESYASAADFWLKKKPSEWTDQEKEELRTKSPWAKKVDAESSGGRAGGGGGANGGGGEGGGGGGNGGGGGGGGSKGGGKGGGGNLAPAANFGGPATSLQIVWQSAKPVLDAHPLALPAKLDGHYIISVTGIPMPVLNATMMGRGGGGGRRGGGGGPDAPGGDNAGAPPAAPPDPTAGLKRAATLTVKGKSPQNADLVMALGNNTSVLFCFAKDVLALTAADKDVEFDLKLGGLTAKAKFSLKDMMYGEELAL